MNELVSFTTWASPVPCVIVEDYASVLDEDFHRRYYRFVFLRAWKKLRSPSC